MYIHAAQECLQWSGNKSGKQTQLINACMCINYNYIVMYYKNNNYITSCMYYVYYITV